MKIALVQSHIVWEDKVKNLCSFERIVQKNSNIDLFLLPEMSFTGFSMNTAITGEENEETKHNIAEICKKFDVAAGFGWVKHKIKSENHYTIIGKNGEDVSDYVKIHPFSFSGEDKCFISGNKLSYFALNDIVFSNFICYDLRFPELFCIASKKAHAIIVPANWPSKRCEHWNTLLKARAIENQVYILAVNCVGDMGGLNYSGDSCVVAPDGEVIVSSHGAETVLIFDMADNVQQFRDDFPTYKDRKDSLYIELQN